ncbi:MAG: pyridoxamine 5'-phosphate oxidase family protein [Bacillota bacterium]
MPTETYAKAMSFLAERFGRDTLISLATVDDGRPSVRIVNAYYEDGAFYVVTYALSNKMKHIAMNPTVAICGEWFTAHGVGENIGHPCDKKNTSLMDRLRKVFAEWYTNGHVDESDPNTCILRIRLTDGVLFHHGTRYEIAFQQGLG